MSSPAHLSESDWKNPALVRQWKKDRKARFDWRKNFNPLLAGVPLAADPPAALELPQETREVIQWENESLSSRLARVDPPQSVKPSKRTAAQARHQVPASIGRDDSGALVIAPALARAPKGQIEKSIRMFDLGLEKKAQRQAACGILGGEVHCRGGHNFFTAYRCGNRYCSNCAPLDGKKLFARQRDKLLFVSQRLMLCGEENCEECFHALEEERIPHWPPPRGEGKPRIVCAKIDFTLRHDRFKGMPGPDVMRYLNQCIKKFFRALEKNLGIRRCEYGIAFCDELGGNNSNPHAHCIYVGPWLPQNKKELSALWQEVTGDSFIVSIKYARNFTEALFHAVKYPAKFAQRSSPERLAELERVFHRVRRFHTLAAFYNPEAPAQEKPPIKRCPICDELLSEPRGFQTVEYLSRIRGLKDIDAVRAQVARDRALAGTDLPPP